MDYIAVQKFKQDFALKTLIQEVQFGQWLSRLFYLNNALHREYDSLYQESYYVKLNAVLTEGLEYANKVYQNVLRAKETFKDIPIKMNEGKVDWYDVLIKGLNDIRATLSDDEFDFIEYKRHGASHIFQNNYEVGFTRDGKLKTKCKGEDIDQVTDRFKSLLTQHGMDKGFDLYITKKLYPLISKLYNDLDKNST